MRLAERELTFATNSIVDPVGRVFLHGGRVFRAIAGEADASFYRRLLAEQWIGDAFEAGLVRTWIPKDVEIDGAALVLEHERIPFTVFPAEFTSEMLWHSAKTLADVATVLARHGVFIKDAHPWNVLFAKGKASYVDFGSIQVSEIPRREWLDEFRRYFAVPLWLASNRMSGLAQEYRREHGRGFGLRLFNLAPLRWPLALSLPRIGRRSEPVAFFERVRAWVERHRPVRSRKERWASYEQSGHGPDPLKPTTEKQRFVYDVLTSTRPATVLDCAANKGLFSEMAARLGASVVAFDYEEYCVDECFRLARHHDLDITPAVMDFRFPTAPSGWGLSYPSSFERFRAEIVLALGLVHHLCIAQRVPVRLFCEACLAYSTAGIVLEYVDPTDMHIAMWKMTPPADYSVEGFSRYLSTKYPHRNMAAWTSPEGINRTLLFFHR
jgi:hypothetical protein